MFADCSSDATGNAKDSCPCPYEGSVLIEPTGGREPRKVPEAPEDRHGACQGSWNQGPKPLRTLTGPGKGPGTSGRGQGCD